MSKSESDYKKGLALRRGGGRGESRGEPGRVVENLGKGILHN